MKLAEALRQRVAAEHPGAFEVGRSLNSKTFDIGGGQRRVVQRMAPIHWRANLADGAETWKEIDLSLSLGPGGQYRVVSGFYAVQVDQAQVSYRYATNRATAVTVVTLAEVGGAAPDYSGMTVEVAGNRLTWRNVAPGVDMFLVCRPRYAELFKVVHDAAASRSFGWQVTEDADDNPARAARFVRETAGWDAARDPLEITTAVANERTLVGGRRRFLFRETWSGRVSRITDRATRQRAWFADAAYPATIDATVTENIGAGADDGQELGGSWSGTFSTIVAGRGYGGTVEHAGFRFQTIDVPQGASVSSATLTLRVPTIDGTPTASLYADDVDDAPAWGSGSRPSSGFTKTTAKTDITSAIGTGLKALDVKTIVQEVVDRAGWTNNNDMRFALFNTKASGSYQEFLIEAYEALGTDEAQLDITYTAGGGGGATATPGVLAASTARFAPTVTASDHKMATPGVLAAALSTLAPTVSVSDHKTATPAVAALVASLFAPVPAATAHRAATPAVVSLSTAALAPGVTASDHQTATPAAASLAGNGFAPTASASAHQVATPVTLAANASAFTPAVTASDHRTATPGAASLATSPFAPVPSTTADQVATLVPASLALDGPSPAVTATAHVVVAVALLALHLSAFAPAVEGGAVATPLAVAGAGSYLAAPAHAASHTPAPAIEGGYVAAPAFEGRV